MSRLMRSVVVASVLAAVVLAAAMLSVSAVPRTTASAGTAMAPRHADKLAAAATRAGLLSVANAKAAGSGAPAAITVTYPCTSATPYGSVLIKPSQWATGLVNTGHDGANFDVYSNYASGSCDRPPASTDGADAWGTEYQCAELAIRVADAEWATGTQQAWLNAKNANWDGSAADMAAPGQALGLTWTANGSGTLPAPGDLMIWSSSGNGDPGHVGVVSAVTSTSVTFVGENQADGMVTLPVSGTTVENDGWKSGSTITGWLSHQWTTSTLGATSTSPPLPANAGANGYAFLESVACPSTGSCVAVGNYMDSSGTWQGLIETLSGGSWEATEVTLPGNADGDPNASLVSVACPSKTKCVAVGYYNDSTSALLVTGSGINWTATQAPLPANAQSGQYAYLTSVACPSATSCVAVGGYNGTSGGASSELIVTGPAGSGSAWTPTEAPLPLNGLSFYNSSWPAVACSSTTSCVTAWTYDDSSGTQQGVLESGSGINWTPSEVPLPANASTSNPKVILGSGISVGRPLACSTATCVMVGQYVDSSGNTDGLLVTGSGTNWTQTEAPLPANAAANGFDGLNSVACESAATCVAAGQYSISSGKLKGLLLTGLETSWKPAAAPVPVNALANPQVRLDSVTCPSTSWCVTAGAYPAVAPGGGQTIPGLAVIGAGTAWNTTPAPLPGNAYSGTTYLMSVACPSKTSCVAVGGYYDANWYGLVATGAP
jgi:hypothetical protein